MSVLRFEVRCCADMHDTADETPYCSLDAAYEHYREALDDMWDVELVAVMTNGQIVLLATKDGS